METFASEIGTSIQFVFLPQFHGETFGSDFQRKWEGLQKILEKQRSKGGIIDPEVESNRFLIHINEVRAHSDVHASLLPGGKRLFVTF